MIATVLREAGINCLPTWRANLITGVTTSFIRDAGIRGKISCDYAVLEVDEASLPRVLKEVKPGVLILTNFSRDQLDRYEELDRITGIIREALVQQKQMTLILNADDPLVAQFQRSTSFPTVFYGMDPNEQTRGPASRPGKASSVPSAAIFLHTSFPQQPAG